MDSDVYDCLVFLSVTARSLLVIAIVMLLVPVTAANAQDVVATAPEASISVAETDMIRFAWVADSGQDQFKIIFSQTDWSSWSMWSASPFHTSWIYGSSHLTSPALEMLNSGTWYWRICAAWSSDGLFPTCYMTSAGGVINVLSASDVAASYPPLGIATARGGARWVGTNRFKGRYMGASCVRHSASQVLCYVRMNRNGKGFARYVYLWNNEDGELTYSLRGF